MDVNITGLVTASMPAILALLQARHHDANPDAPPLTDAQVFAALHDAVLQTVAKDDAIAADIRSRNA